MTHKTKKPGRAVISAPSCTTSVNVVATPTAILPMDLAPLEAALRFIGDRPVAYHESQKRYHLFDSAARRWEDLTGNQLQRELKRWMQHRWGHTVKATTLKQMVAEIEVNAPLWHPQRHPGKLVVGNGDLDFTGTSPHLLPHDTTLQFEHKLDVAYHPDAKCPKFERFLHEAVGADDAGLVQKWLGAALAGANQSQVVLAMVGNPGTGKGTLVNLVMNLVGVEQTAELRVDKFTERFELSAYLGRRLLVAPEIPSDLLSIKGIGRLKALVGQDRMEAELKNQNRRVPVNGDFHVILHGNRLCSHLWSPDVDAFRRRLLIVEFNRQRPVKVVPNLAEELWREEAAGILAWAVEGVRRYRAEIAINGAITLAAEQQARVDRLIPPPPKPSQSQADEEPQHSSGANHLLDWLIGQLQRFGIRLESIKPRALVQQ